MKNNKYFFQDFSTSIKTLSTLKIFFSTLHIFFRLLSKSFDFSKVDKFFHKVEDFRRKFFDFPKKTFDFSSFRLCIYESRKLSTVHNSQGSWRANFLLVQLKIIIILQLLVKLQLCHSTALAYVIFWKFSTFHKTKSKQYKVEKYVWKKDSTLLKVVLVFSFFSFDFSKV